MYKGGLFYQIYDYLKGKECRVYAAPFNVLLPEYPGQAEDDVPNVVQPDISVTCDRKKPSEANCLGSPDMVIEVLSPHTSNKDRTFKLRLYEEYRVREYWLVDPGNKFVHVFLLNEDDKYPEEPQLYLTEERIQ